MQLTQEQVNFVHAAITGADTKFVKMFAQAAIRSSLDVHSDMFLDRELGTQPPSNEDIREYARDFFNDMGHSFVDAVKKEIEAVQFNANIKAVQMLNSNLTFK